MQEQGRELTAREGTTFIEQGFVTIEEAFPAELAAASRTVLWRDTGCDPNDRSAWTQPVVRLGFYSQPPFVAAANRPTLRHAFDQPGGAGPLGVLATGNAGTVYLCHPFLVHAAQPHRGTWPRFMAQPSLLPSSGRLELTRPDGDYAPVEAAIRTALMM